jgi:hypothetical protein
MVTLHNIADITCGLVSGIPLCCILHYVNNDCDYPVDDPKLVKYSLYIPCPECRAKQRIAEVKRCATCDKCNDDDICPSIFVPPMFIL